MLPPTPRSSAALMALLALAALILAPAAPARAGATIAVTVSNQEQPFVTNGNCTLGEAIQAANTDSAVDACPAGSGADTIVFSGSRYTSLTASAGDETGLPAISSAITISGGSISRSSDAGIPPFRLLRVTPTGDLTLSSVSLSNGRAQDGGAVLVERGRLTIRDGSLNGNRAVDGSGGAIFNSGGDVTLTRVELGYNMVVRSGAATARTSFVGGVIAAEGGRVTISDGRVTANQVLNEDDTTWAGGGVVAVSGGDLTIERTRLLGNLVRGAAGATRGGAVLFEPGALPTGIMRIENTTISINVVPGGAGGAIFTSGGGTVAYSTIVGNGAASGGGLVSSGPPVAVHNTILLDNAAAAGPDCSGAVGGSDTNLHAPGGGCPRQSGARWTDDARLVPLLPPLQLTYRPLPDSPAIDAAAGDCPPTDGLGVARTPPCDIGADELPPATFHEVACAADPAPRVQALVAALDAANASAGPDRIALAPGCVYTLTQPHITDADGRSGLPVVAGDIEVAGFGARIERATAPGTPPFRIFTVASSGALTLSDVTLANGHALGDSGSTGQPAMGGAVLVHGALTLADSTVRDSRAEGGASTWVASPGGTGWGGGVAVANSETGPIALVRSALFGNQSLGGAAAGADGGVGAGGALAFLESRANIFIASSTISGNQTSGYAPVGGAGGGIAISRAYVHMHGATVTNNLASGPGAFGGGVVIHTSGTLYYGNSILLGNSATLSPDCGKIDWPHNAFPSWGYSLLVNGGGCVSSNGLAQPSDVRLGPLADNGGRTLTHALLPGSPAIDAGQIDFYMFTDQRGVALPQGGRADIGAFEVAAPVTTPTPTNTPTETPTNTPTETPTLQVRVLLPIAER